jgi:hypothetical protein
VGQELTFSDKDVGQSLFVQHLDVHGRTISDLIIDIVQASTQSACITHLPTSSPSQQHIYTLHDSLVINTDAKLGQTANCRSPDNGVLEDHAVIDVPDELGRVAGLGSFHTEQV